jgi:type IV pilus assembly protein PilX
MIALPTCSAPSGRCRKMPGAVLPSLNHQRGVVLLIALIMLIAMTLVGVSMLRSVGAGAGIAGNLAFKQNATAAADLGAEIARTWVYNTGAATPLVLDAVSAANGYYTTWADTFNPLTHDWANSKKLTSAEAAFITAAGKDTAGNEVRYVVHRLCALDGVVSPIDNIGQKCANFTDYGALGSKGGTGYGQKTPTLSEQPYYRVTVRASGPRNTVSYVQVVMY